MSALRDRLSALRGQALGEAPAQARSVSSLAERIGRQRVGLESGSNLGQGRRMDETTLALSLGATRLAPGLLLLEHGLDCETTHGSVPLSAELGPAISLFWPASPPDPESLVFVDTETTGLSGGTGTLIFMVGLGRFRGGRLQLSQYLLTAFQGESAMLDHVRDFCADSEVMVTYNGLSFDCPLLKTRFRLDGRDDPLHRLGHIDLLHHCRRAFARTWSDCRLQTVERKLLHFHRHDDLPGSEAPLAWLDWVRRGDGSRLRGVVEHNRWDLVSLAALLRVLGELYHEPGIADVNHAGIARWYVARSRHDEALRVLRTGARMLDDRGRLELAQLSRRQGDSELARRIWRELAAEDCTEALLCLAKHLEHQCADPRSALAMTQRLIDLQGPIPEHLHRKERLRRKTGLIRQGLSP